MIKDTQLKFHMVPKHDILKVYHHIQAAETKSFRNTLKDLSDRQNLKLWIKDGIGFTLSKCKV